MKVELGNTARAFALSETIPADVKLLGVVEFDGRRGALVQHNAGSYSLVRNGCSTYLPRAQTDMAVECASERPDLRADTGNLIDCLDVTLRRIAAKRAARD